MLMLTLVFWGLDGYYLKQERLFRRLYDKVRQIDPDQVDYSMDVSGFPKINRYRYIPLLASVSLLPFYSALVILCVVYTIVS